jgi:uncharacterized protein YhfF/ribosomal protein S18 acetylase RimI-like enzyme
MIYTRQEEMGMIRIEQISGNDVPDELVYLADEDETHISTYRDTALFWAAWIDDRIAGIIGVKEIDYAGTSSTGIEIVCVAVHEQFQNRGIGVALVQTTIQYAKAGTYSDILVKTGNSSIKPLYLYQKCGFRFDSVIPDYFAEQYGHPIYENGLRCLDQIVLRYRIYSGAELQVIQESYWDRFVCRYPEYKQAAYDVWMFGYDDSVANRLIGLVKQGKKTGTSSALELYCDDEKKPGAGGLSMVTYGNGLPGCILLTEEIRIKKFCNITPEEALLEGEGDLSLRYWQEAHRAFFTREYAEAGKLFSENMPVIFERFRVLYDEDRKW